MTTARVISEQKMRIEPSLVPECDYRLGCAILEGCIRRALADPQKREEFELWKRERNL